MTPRAAILLGLLLLTSCAATGDERYARPQRVLVPVVPASRAPDPVTEIPGGKGKENEMGRPFAMAQATPSPIVRTSMPRPRPPPR